MHECAVEQRAHLAEVTVILVLAALYDAAIGGLDVLSGGEGHGLREDARMVCASFIILLNGWLINADILHVNNVPNL